MKFEDFKHKVIFGSLGAKNHYELLGLYLRYSRTEHLFLPVIRKIKCASWHNKAYISSVSAPSRHPWLENMRRILKCLNYDFDAAKRFIWFLAHTHRKPFYKSIPQWRKFEYVANQRDSNKYLRNLDKDPLHVRSKFHADSSKSPKYIKHNLLSSEHNESHLGLYREDGGIEVWRSVYIKKTALPLSRFKIIMSNLKIRLNHKKTTLPKPIGHLRNDRCRYKIYDFGDLLNAFNIKI